jgi:hypothetical protein
MTNEATMIMSLDGQMDSTIKRVWRSIITWTPSNRITDYAKPLAGCLDQYTPSLFTSIENQQIQQWMRRLYVQLAADSFERRLHADSNWQAYRLWIMGKLAYILKSETFITTVRQAISTYLSRTMRADGSFNDFHTRDSIAYQAYTMYAVVKCYQVISQPLWRRNGSVYTKIVTAIPETTWWPMLRPSFVFLYPYCVGQKSHIEYVRSIIAADQQKSTYGKAFTMTSVTYLLDMAMATMFMFGDWWESMA